MLRQYGLLSRHFGTGLLNTPQQRSFSHIFDVSYPPCQTILRCSGISAQHSQTLLSQQNPQRYMHPLHPALRSNSIPFLPNIFQHNTLNQKFLIPAHIDPSCLKTEATVLIKILISNPKFQFAIYFISSFTTSSKSVISLLPLTCHIPVIPGFTARRAR